MELCSRRTVHLSDSVLGIVSTACGLCPPPLWSCWKDVSGRIRDTVMKRLKSSEYVQSCIDIVINAFPGPDQSAMTLARAVLAYCTTTVFIEVLQDYASARKRQSVVSTAR